MAISPKSKGLGNIGNIVNRQGLASPTRPAARPVAKMPVPKPMSKVNPFAGGKTTTAAQRQAYQPFRSATKPVPKVNPMAQQPAMPMTPPQVSPQPFNPFNNPVQLPGLPYFPGGQDPDSGMMPEPILGYEPWLMPGGQPPSEVNPDMISDPMQAYYAQQALQTGQQGLGQMFKNQIAQVPAGQDPMSYLGFQSDFGGQMFNQPNLFNGLNTGGKFSSLGSAFGNSLANSMAQGIGSMISQPGVQGPGPAPGQDSMEYYNQNPNEVLRPGFDFSGNVSMPNTWNNDYDQLEGSSFNTNPSGGSLFGNGGFAGK